jgi:hypothetical protein
MHGPEEISYWKFVVSGLRRDADEICAFLRYYAASNGNPLPTFRDNVSVPSSRVKKSCLETSVNDNDKW